MIVVDTSAIVAIVFDEPERDAFIQAIRQTDRALISTVSVAEAQMVVHGRRGQQAVLFLNDLLRLPVFESVAPGAAEAGAAYAAFVAFGRGSGHKAQLNFGDGGEVRKDFFFVKKKQKTFIHYLRKTDKKFFGSFFKKELFSYFLPVKNSASSPD